MARERKRLAAPRLVLLSVVDRTSRSWRSDGSGATGANPECEWSRRDVRGYGTAGNGGGQVRRRLLVRRPDCNSSDQAQSCLLVARKYRNPLECCWPGAVFYGTPGAGRMFPKPGLAGKKAVSVNLTKISRSLVPKIAGITPTAH
jgi:hypothetical protein